MARLRFKDYLVVAGGVLLIVLSVSLAQVNSVGAAGSPSVTVVNTPLPVTGTVNANVTGNVGVTGTPSVSVTNFPATQPVSGTVGITVIPSVNIVNTPTVTLVQPGTAVSGFRVLNDFNLHPLIAISGTSSFSLTDVTVSNPTALEEAMHLYIGTVPLYGMTSPAGTTFTQSFSTPIEFVGSDLVVGCDNCTASAAITVTLSGRIH